MGGSWASIPIFSCDCNSITIVTSLRFLLSSLPPSFSFSPFIHSTICWHIACHQSLLWILREWALSDPHVYISSLIPIGSIHSFIHPFIDIYWVLFMQMILLNTTHALSQTCPLEDFVTCPGYSEIRKLFIMMNSDISRISRDLSPIFLISAISWK